MSSPDTVRDQQRILQDLAAEYEQHVRRILQVGPLLKGSFYPMQTRCGNPSCHCARPGGRRHAATVLSWSEAGRNRMRSIPAPQRSRVRRLAAQYRGLRQARSALTPLHQQILQSINRLEQALRLPPPALASRRQASWRSRG